MDFLPQEDGAGLTCVLQGAKCVDVEEPLQLLTRIGRTFLTKKISNDAGFIARGMIIDLRARRQASSQGSVFEVAKVQLPGPLLGLVMRRVLTANAGSL